MANARNANGDVFAAGVMRCKNCRWWAQLTPADWEHKAERYGPWPSEKPAGSCKRFPPTRPWGATESAQAHGVGSSLCTFDDDWCGEFQPDEAHL